MRRAWCAFFFLVSAAAPAQTIDFQDGVSPDGGYAGTRDVRLFDGADEAWQPDVNYQGVDNQVDGPPRSKAALVRFDLSSVDAGVVGVVIGATLTLHLTRPTLSTYNLYPVTKNWDPATATWNQAASGQPWGSPGASLVQPVGGDREGLVIGTLGPGAYGSVDVPLNAAGIGIAAGWATGTLANQGFMFQTNRASDGVSWANGEAADPSVRPQLTLVFVDSTGTVVLRNGFNGYSGEVDTTIASGADPRTYNWNGAGLVLGPNSGALVSFDLSPGGIPADAQVLGATLSFTANGLSSQSFPLYEALRPWTESQATWLTYDGVTPWMVAGGDDASDHGSEVLGELSSVSMNQAIASLNDAGLAAVQAWVSGARPNNGFFIAGSADAGNLPLDDRETPTPAARPRFEVVYAPPSTPPGGSLNRSEIAGWGCALGGGAGVPASLFCALLLLYVTSRRRR